MYIDLGAKKIIATAKVEQKIAIEIKTFSGPLILYDHRATYELKCAPDAKKNKLKSWRVESWGIAEAGPDFVYGMEEVLEVYARPYNPEHPVVCLDEFPKQLISERRQSFTDANMNTIEREPLTCIW